MITRIGAAAAHFGRDVDRGLTKIIGIVRSARRDGVDLLVLPGASLGGYLGDLRHPSQHELPPALDLDGPELRQLVQAAGDLVLCVGFCEQAADHAVTDRRYNAAVCLSGDGILGHHRKVHQPAGEYLAYDAGDTFTAFDTPVGRLGMVIDYDKTFPESTRTLALDGARIVAALSAWPASVTDRAARMVQDRQSRLFDLYDLARAAENQVVLASANQTGIFGGLRFLGQAKVVGPGGEVLSKTWSKGALAVADLDVDAEVERARRVLRHLEERRPDSYRQLLTDKLGP